MLKKIILNQKTIPVPIPISNLGETVNWVNQTLVRPGFAITSIIIDDQVWDECDNRGFNDQTLVNEKTRIEFRVDSPQDLAVQTLETIHNFVVLQESRLKPLAVQCWQLGSKEKSKDLAEFETDLNLILELNQHLQSLIDLKNPVASGLSGIMTLVFKSQSNFCQAVKLCDWSAAARILLNRFEPEFKDLREEVITLQTHLLKSTIELKSASSNSMSFGT